MSKIKLYILVSFCLISFQSVFAQSLDAILSQHFKVIGQEKLLKVKTITTEGTLLQAGVTIAIKSFSKRPNKLRVQGTLNKKTFIQAFDGTKAWGINPFAGQKQPGLLSPAETRQLSDQANIDGLLFNYNEKGYTAELLDPQNLGNVLVDVIKLTKADSSEIIYYLDSETSAVLRSVNSMKISGIDRQYESIFSNYNYVDGILFPFTVTVYTNGQEIMRYNFKKIELDKPVPDFIFDMPQRIEQ